VETLAQTLQRELDSGDDGPVSLGRLLHALGARGPAALMVVLPLPFALPIQIPGLSLPFGLILLLVGAQLGWRERLWCPQMLADREIPRAFVQKFVGWVDRTESILLRWFAPRIPMLTESRWAHRFVGILVMLLAAVLCMPIPLPFSNMLVAIPLVVLGLALLSQDGVALLGGILLSALGLSALVGLATVAYHQITQVARQIGLRSLA
jgi:hypothetical protein